MEVSQNYREKNDQTDVDLTHKIKIKLFQSAINLIFVQITLQKDFFLSTLV